MRRDLPTGTVTFGRNAGESAEAADEDVLAELTRLERDPAIDLPRAGRPACGGAGGARPGRSERHR